MFIELKIFLTGFKIQKEMLDGYSKDPVKQ